MEDGFKLGRLGYPFIDHHLMRLFQLRRRRCHFLLLLLLIAVGEDCMNKLLPLFELLCGLRLKVRISSTLILKLEITKRIGEHTPLQIKQEKFFDEVGID